MNSVISIRALGRRTIICENDVGERFARQQINHVDLVEKEEEMSLLRVQKKDSLYPC